MVAGEQRNGLRLGDGEIKKAFFNGFFFSFSSLSLSLKIEIFRYWGGYGRPAPVLTADFPRPAPLRSMNLLMLVKPSHPQANNKAKIKK